MSSSFGLTSHPPDLVLRVTKLIILNKEVNDVMKIVIMKIFT